MVLLETTPLPGPPELPFLGNIADINNFEVPLWSFHELAEKYGKSEDSQRDITWKWIPLEGNNN